MRVMKRVDIQYLSTQRPSRSVDYRALKVLWNMRDSVGDIVEPIGRLTSLEAKRDAEVQGPSA
jgi:hypothetical protein